MPIVFFAFVHKPLATWSKKLYLGIFILTITGYLIGMPTRVILSQNHGRFEELNAPVDQWVQAIAAAGFEKGLIIAESQWLAGNLKIYFPESQAYPAWADIQIKEPQSILVVWCNKPLPEKLEHQMKNLGYDLTEPQYIETPVLYGKGGMTLGMAFAKNEWSDNFHVPPGWHICQTETAQGQLLLERAVCNANGHTVDSGMAHLEYGRGP